MFNIATCMAVMVAVCKHSSCRVVWPQGCTFRVMDSAASRLTECTVHCAECAQAGPCLVQPRMGDLREVVVLIVVAHIVGQAVQGPIVRIGLLALQPKQQGQLRGVRQAVGWEGTCLKAQGKRQNQPQANCRHILQLPSPASCS